MSLRALTWALDSAPSYLSSPERFVLVALADHVDDSTGQGWPSVARLSRRTALSRRTVQRALRVLCEVRLISPGGIGPAKRSDRATVLYNWHPERALASWHRQAALTDDLDSAVATVVDDPPGSTLMRIALFVDNPDDTGRHAVTPSSHGASETTSTGRHTDARTKNRNPQEQPGGWLPNGESPRAGAREPVDRQATTARGAALARQVLAGAISPRIPDDVEDAR